MDCQYECYECEDTARCDTCNGPWCNYCDGAAYKYYATSTLCDDDIILHLQLNYGDCPILDVDDILTLDIEYDCYIPITNKQCKYNGESVFVFDNDDESIHIGHKYVDIGYILVTFGCICLCIMITICCRRCIKNLPCMN